MSISKDRPPYTVDQRDFDENGVGLDCFKCCLATVILRPYEDVPPLDGGPNGDPMEQMQQAQDYLGSLTPPMEMLAGGGVQALKKILPSNYFIGSGISPRSTEENVFYHAVVCKLDGEGIVRIVHDPHPSRAGVKGDVDYFYWFQYKEK